MLAEDAIQPQVVTDSSHHRMTFFRQSGWMIVATVISGFFASAVHILSKWVPRPEYSAAASMIQIIAWMGIPSLGLQLVFAHQASAAVTEQQRRQFMGTFKAVMRWTFYIWLVMALIVAADYSRLQNTLHLTNRWSLAFMVVSGLMMLWTPMFNGLLQGRQNFLWMGWVSIINSAGRVAIAAIIVLVFNGWAAGIVAGMMLGLALGVAVAFWQNWDIWREPTEPFDALAWLKHVTPLTLTAGVGQFITSADAVAVQAYFGAGDAAAPYMIGGTLARAIPLATAPLAAVMFPKLVHRKARTDSGGPNLLLLTFLGTLILGCLGAGGLTLTSSLLIRLGSRPEFVSIVPLVPLFAWSMVPLCLGNVLLNNLNAHSYFRPVPILVIMAAAYWVALTNFHSSFKTVIELLGTVNLVYLAIVGFFTLLQQRAEKRSRPQAASAS